LHSSKILKVTTVVRIQLIVELIKEKNKSAERAQLFHEQIYRVMQPIFETMADGINLLCGDGKRRWCFPRFATFMGDYEEAWRACGVLHGHCVACTIPTFRRTKEGEFHVNIERNDHVARTGAESLRLREEYKAAPSRAALRKLNDKGYHTIDLFTDQFPIPGCSIYDAIAPDLLHQASKNFRDQIFDKWCQAVVKTGTSESALNAELDSRFQHIPAYQGLRWFNRGISHIKRWTGPEYKGMMRVFMGIARGLCDDILLSMIKTYLDAHRLSHYPSHSDQGIGLNPGTLQYLEIAVAEFFRDLQNPDGTLVQSAVIKADFMTNKLHAMTHYAEWVRQKGSLPQFSTDCTEALHRIYKAYWRASNKGHESDKTVCLNEWRTIGMLMFNEELRLEAMKEVRAARGLKESGLEEEEEGLEQSDDAVDADEDKDGDEEDERGYDRMYEWEMLLPSDELDFEYLGPDDQTEDELTARRERELIEIEGRKRKLCLGARFTGAKLKGFPLELEHAAEKLGLIERDFVQQTLRELCWIKAGRMAGTKLPRGKITLLEVEKIMVTRVFEAFECVYAKISDVNILVKEIHRCTDAFALGGKKAWTEGRHDTVLVNYDRPEDATRTMTGRRVARLWCLFTVDVLDNPSLALVQWFECKEDPEAVTNMYLVNKTDKYEVIELSTIERGVHLIPDFGPIGPTTPWLEIAEGGTKVLRGLDAYDKFVINNHLDLDIFNMIS
jgi:Plavaka transposase